MTQLRRNGKQWTFHNESVLEEFVWANLKSLFSFLPLKRQYRLNGQIYDILAVTQDQQLVVIELKNEVDRYVVQQLTRYYHVLHQEQPFSEQVDYSKPIRLIAIAPDFHRDSLIDQQYSRLSIEFLKFKLVPNFDQFDQQIVWDLHLQHLGTQQTWVHNTTTRILDLDEAGLLPLRQQQYNGGSKRPTEAIRVVESHEAHLFLQDCRTELIFRGHHLAADAAFRASAFWVDTKALLIQCKIPEDAKSLRQQYRFLIEQAADHKLERVLLGWEKCDRPYVFLASMRDEETKIPL